MKLLIRDSGLGHARYSFGPCESCSFPLVEQVSRLAPDLNERQLFRLEPFLREVSGVQVETIRATVDLRNSQIDEINENA